MGTITKYAVPKPVNGTDFEVSADKKLTAKKDNMEYKLSTAATYTDLTNGTPTEALAEGSYLIRFKAVANAYAESEATSFTISNGGSVFQPITVFDGSTMTALENLPSSVTRIDTSSKQSIDANNKSLNGKSFTHRFKFGGKDNDTHAANALKITTGTTSSVKIIAYAMSSSNGTTGYLKVKGNGDAIVLHTNDGSSLTASEEINVTPDSEGNIYIWADTQAMNLYYLYISQ